MLKIKDFILNEEIPEVDKKPKTKTDVEYVFSIEYENDTDFILKKITQNTERLLVVLVSQAQIYIKDVKKNTVEKLTDSTQLQGFRRGMGSVPNFEKLTWKPFYEKTTGSYYNRRINIDTTSEFDDLLTCPKTYQFLSNKKLNPFRDSALVNRYNRNPEAFTQINEVLNAVRLFKPTFSVSYGDYNSIAQNILASKLDYNLIKKNLSTITELGPDTFLSILRESQFSSIINDYLCDFTRLLKYFLYTIKYRNGLSVGYYGDFSLSQYADYLRMQKEMYGYVKEKYPLYWLSEKQMMNNKYNNWRKLQHERDFSLEQEKMKKYEYSDSVFSVVVPLNSSDILDEAQQQQHCVASYIDRIRQGETHIVFIRLNMNPDESYLTVQITPDGRIIQVKGFQNRHYTAIEYAFMKKWATEKELKLEVNEIV